MSRFIRNVYPSVLTDNNDDKDDNTSDDEQAHLHILVSESTSALFANKMVWATDLPPHSFADAICASSEPLRRHSQCI